VRIGASTPTTALFANAVLALTWDVALPLPLPLPLLVGLLVARTHTVHHLRRLWVCSKRTRIYSAAHTRRHAIHGCIHRELHLISPHHRRRKRKRGHLIRNHRRRHHRSHLAITLVPIITTPHHHPFLQPQWGARLLEQLS
jgi:hypothetical protein